MQNYSKMTAKHILRRTNAEKENSTHRINKNRKEGKKTKKKSFEMNLKYLTMNYANENKMPNRI